MSAASLAALPGGICRDGVGGRRERCCTTDLPTGGKRLFPAARHLSPPPHTRTQRRRGGGRRPPCLASTGRRIRTPAAVEAARTCLPERRGRRDGGGGRARGVSVVGGTWGGVSPSALRRTGELPQDEGRSVVPAPTAARGAGEGAFNGRLGASCTVSGGGAAPQRAEVGWRSVPAGEGSGRLPAAGAGLWCSAAGDPAGESPLPSPLRNAAFVLPPHLSAGLGGTAQVGAGTAAAAAHPRSRGGEVRRGCAVLRRPLPGLRGAAARRGLRLRPAAGAEGRARPLLGFACSRFPFRPAAHREMQQRQPGPPGKDGARRWASRISPAGARWGCRARGWGRGRGEQPAVPSRSRGVRAAPAVLRGALRAAAARLLRRRSHPRGARSALLRSAPAGPGHGGGAHKAGHFPCFPPPQNAEMRGADAGVCA